MNSLRTLPRLIILGCAFLGASIGTCFQTLRITGKPQEFRSLAKLVTGKLNASNDTVTWRDYMENLYGTVIETVESAEMKRLALEHVRALSPGLKDCDVDILAVQTKGSGIINILATGSDPKYTRIFLDALLDEFIAFRQNIREQMTGKVLQQFLREVVGQQKGMEESMAALEKVRARVGGVSAKSDQERLVARLNSLRNQRDDLRLKLKPMGENDAAHAALHSQVEALDSEIQRIESGLQLLEPDLSELRTLTERHAARKAAYDKLLQKVEILEGVFNSQLQSDYVAIQERATPASENVEDWTMPIALGAGGGGLLGGLIGWALSLIILLSPKPPQMPAAG